jgi:hypothetical protein
LELTKMAIATFFISTSSKDSRYLG